MHRGGATRGGKRHRLDPDTEGCWDPLLCPPSSYIPSFVSRCRSAEHCQEFTSPLGIFVFPEEKQVTCGATFTMQTTASCRRTNERARTQTCWRFLFNLSATSSSPVSKRFCLLPQTPSVSPSASAADERCTCCAHTEQAQDRQPPPSSLPPPSLAPACSLCPLP